jgi:hypothetical protein
MWGRSKQPTYWRPILFSPPKAALLLPVSGTTIQSALEEKEPDGLKTVKQDLLTVKSHRFEQIRYYLRFNDFAKNKSSHVNFEVRCAEQLP